MESKTTILIVDDDQALGEMLSIVLESEGFATVVCYDGLRAVERFPTIGPDLILLDVMLPGLDGVEVAKEIRNTSQVPIIMLTAKSDTRDVVSGLAAGADDYVAKPFKVAELVARIKARLRVAAPILQARAEDRGNVQVINEGGVTINRAEHTATKNGSDLNLTPMEFELLFVLAANSGEVLSRGELLEKVWGYQNSGDARLVNVHVQRLRQKVEDNPEHPQIIQTVRGVGYKFVPPANDAD
nr:MtrAB system response regulator MtrA [Bifidobacterium pluvialisilvae]